MRSVKRYAYNAKTVEFPVIPMSIITVYNGVFPLR